MSRSKYRHRVSLVPEVGQRLSYVDSVGLRMPNLVSKDQFKDLRRAMIQEMRPNRGKFFLEKVKRPDPKGLTFFMVLWMHQPTRKALNLALDTPSLRFYAAHVALDLCSAGPEEAQRLKSYVERRIHRSWKARLVQRVKGTAYVGRQTLKFVHRDTGEIVRRPARRGTYFALYAERLSKVNEQPCVHLEIRLVGESALKMANLPNLEHVLGLNHWVFWRDRLQFMLPPGMGLLTRACAEAMARRSTVSGDKPMPLEERRIAAAQLIDATFARSGVEVESAAGSDVLYVLQQSKITGKASPKRLFKDEPNWWALPQSPRNALWLSRPVLETRPVKAGRSGSRKRVQRL